MNDAAPVIEAQGLQVQAGNRVLLRDVGLTVNPGERVALVGHNGAGKSTLLRALTGFNANGRVTHGRLRVLETEMGAACRGSSLRQLRARVAQVHQGLHLVGRLSVLDNVLIGGAARHRSPWTWLRRWPAAERDAAHAALRRVGLGDAAARRTDTLSGGERQKVAIARALHQGGQLLLADEPTASLDARAAGEVAGLLAELAAEQAATLVCVLHDLELLPRVASRAVVLRHGALVADVVVGAGTPGLLRELLS